MGSEGPQRNALAPTWILVARGAVFVAAAAFMVVSPLVRQVLGVRSAFARGWVMYAGFAKDICAVEFRERRADGSEERLARLSLLGFDRRSDAPEALRRVTSVDAARQQGRTICGILGPGHDVRLHLRCGERRGSGWRRIEAGEADLCQTREGR